MTRRITLVDFDISPTMATIKLKVETDSSIKCYTKEVPLSSFKRSTTYALIQGFKEILDEINGST